MTRSGTLWSVVAAMSVGSVAMVAAEARQRAPVTYTIVMDKMAFGAAPAGLRVGDTIVWVNRDLFRHTATAADHSFDIDLPAGKSGKTVMKNAGTIAFSCKFHPGMKGRLLVAK